MVKEKKHIIEVCCTGNIGRSPMAEVIGNHTVVDMGLEGKIGFISSGILVKPKYGENVPYDEVVFILNRASENNFLDETHVIEKEYNNNTNYQKIIREKFNVALKNMRFVEAALRNTALYNNFNIELSDRERCQTVVRDDVSVILGMDKGHVGFVEKIYEGRENKPTITTITQYACISEKIPNIFGTRDPELYKDMGNKFGEIMPKVVLRFKEEKNL